MDKQLFDDAIGEVPPSTVDVDAAIVRGRRAARFHRVANPAVAAGVAVVLLSGAVAYTMMRDDGGGPIVGVGSAPTTSVTTAAPSSSTVLPPDKGSPPLPPQCEEKNLETPDEAAARLRQVVTDAVMAQRPDLELKPHSRYPERAPFEFHQLEQYEGPAAVCHLFEGMANTTAPDGDGNVQILVLPDETPGEPYGEQMSCEQQSSGDGFCAEETGPHGEEIVMVESTFGGDVVSHMVKVARADGTTVVLTAENVTTKPKPGIPATADAPPLTYDQLVAVGVDPRLTLFP